MDENKTSLRKKEVLILMVIAAVGIFFLLSGKQAGTPALSKEAQNVQEDCRAIQNKETCYAKAFGNLTKATNMPHAFEVLHELQRVDVESRGCHFIAHTISITETQKDPSRWREIMNSAPQDCSYGAAHGALEVHASTFADGKLPQSEIPTICNNPDTNNCSHILGHLLLILNENDIPKSLQECDGLPHNDLSKFECLTGVFMERITAFNLVEHGLADQSALNWPARVPELEVLCREQSGTHSVACWKEIVHAALVKFHNDPQKIVDFCQTAPGETETRECIDHSLGIIAGAYNFELDKMMPICEVKALASDYKARCYVQLVGATLSTVPQEKPAALKFCGDLEAVYQKDCFERIDNTLKFYSGN